MTREQIEKRLQELLQEHEKAVALQLRLEGAIAVLRELLAAQESAEPEKDEGPVG
jgi:hypothetical protein